ncbi:MAG: hypothetical protein ACWA47_00665 [Brevirhabdus sp.]
MNSEAWPIWRNASYAGLLLAMVGCGLFFPVGGIVTLDGEQVFRCSELLSSGRDDDVVPLVLIAFILSLAVRLLWFRSSPSWLEQAIFVLVSVSILGFALVAFECGSIVETVLYSGYPQPALISVCWVVSAALLLGPPPPTKAD